MSLRQIEAIVPESELGALRALMADARVIELGATNLTDVRVAVRALLPAGLVERFSDDLQARFGASPAFRLVLSSIEATIPEVPESEPSSQETADQGGHEGSRVSREELYQDVSEAAKTTRVYVATVAISTIVAAVGLLRGDVAIIIGAMVIAPLLGPNVALALAATLGDVSLGRRALKTIIIGVVVAAAISMAVGLVLEVDPSVDAILARTRVGISDVVLGLAAGSAGALAFTSAVPAALIGVMVAVALLPPLATAGLLVGSGHTDLAVGAGLLVLTNVACVNVAGVVTFLAQKVGPRTWWEADKAKRATRLAIFLWVLLLVILVVVMLISQPTG